MPFTMEVFRAVLRAEREARVGGREKHAGLSGINKTTIQNAEIGPDVPGIDTVAKLVEAMPGLSLEDFFRKIERRQDSSDTSVDGVPLASGGHDDALQFDSEERIEKRVIRRLSRALAESLESVQGERQADHRLSPEARPHAAERRRDHRKGRPRHVPRNKKKRPKDE